ncbi:hypothetical protein [uncultured Ruminobacter sp.]|uniref:hypothetical protein n=1 Tax=uncultured Ruminobacter sp. TaxID=538947 RepID=UPI002613C576|nr:hypothetical protein [uncultured Ruminobacter sp.]
MYNTNGNSGNHSTGDQKAVLKKGYGFEGNSGDFNVIGPSEMAYRSRECSGFMVVAMFVFLVYISVKFFWSLPSSIDIAVLCLIIISMSRVKKFFSDLGDNVNRRRVLTAEIALGLNIVISLVIVIMLIAAVPSHAGVSSENLSEEAFRYMTTSKLVMVLLMMLLNVLSYLYMLYVWIVTFRVLRSHGRKRFSGI